MNKVLGIIIVLILIGVGWLIVSNRTASNESNRQAQSSPASQTTEKTPDFALQDFGGKTVRPADFAGKSLVINSWAVWCPFCRKELVDFVAAQKEFGNKVVIIAVDRAETRDVAKKYADDLGVTDGLIFLLDPSDSFYQSIGGFSMPETIFVDQKGLVVDHKRGPMDINEMRTKIEKLLPK
ncbi:MAG: TlpA family protein disulfide reductase [Candidatus Liptonbacteria bacterium]|nr:TlpA family protein disulfide reductase [Candidatus Liptonbacteria bacterium]